MKNKKIVVLFTLASSMILGGCDLLPFGKKEENHTYYVTFHQDGAEDVRIEFNKETKQSEIEIQEPDLESKDGYTVAWEEYSIDGKNESFTVQAIYTPITYYATFKAQGTLVDDVAFTINDITGEHSKLPADREPQVPDHPWAAPYWEDYSLALNNITVNAKYDVLKQFNVSFYVNGTQVGETITIDRDDLTEEGQIKAECIPTAVTEYELQNYEVSWDFTISAAVDQAINATVELHKYYIQFVDFDGEQVGELVPYTIDNTTWASITKPDAPELEGYDTSWNDATLTYSDDEVVVATPAKTGKHYFVTFDGFDDPQEVTYGEAYTLEHAPTALQQWVDSNGNVISTTGTWNSASNVTVHIEAKTKENFDSLVVPDFVDVTNSQNITSVEIVEGAGIDGSNALKFKVVKGDFGLKIKKSYLDEVFGDSEVKALTFVAKGSFYNNNWRHRTNSANVCYEQNDMRFGLKTHYKKFSFTRAMYDLHVDSDFVIYGGVNQDLQCGGLEVYIDSFIYNEDNVFNDFNTKLNFETGTYYDNGGTEFSWMSTFGTGSSDFDKFFILKNQAVVMSDCGYSNEYKTEGSSSLTFTKTNGYVALYLGKKFTQKIEDSESKKFAFDIYSTVYINSNGAVNNIMNGVNGNFSAFGGKLENNKWTTFEFDSTMITASSDSGRFLIIQGSTAGTFYIDNIRILPAEAE